MRLPLIILLFLVAAPLPAQDPAPYKSKPRSHEQNKQLAASAYQDNLKKYAGDTNVLVRPGLLAHRTEKRVEVAVESTGLGPNAPCEFAIIAENSDHGYEALLISLARAGDVHEALQFIGTEPGAAFDPGSLRFWAKGETFVLRIVRTNEPPVRLEKLLIDRRTGKPLREAGFMFAGSRKVPAIEDPQRMVYAADEHQPMAIVSLFNSTHSVFEVPYSASKATVYQNTIVNPEHPLPAGALMSLVIEPVDKAGSTRVKNLVLRVAADPNRTDRPGTDFSRLTGLRLELKDSETVLNAQPTLTSVLETLAALDRVNHDYYLTIYLGETVALGQAQALANVFSAIDRENGVRIEPPPPGQLHYGAFTPDHQLLNRAERSYQPWELALSEAAGQVSGKLLRIDSVWPTGAVAAELELVELLVAGPRELRKELEAADEQARTRNTRATPPVIMVFAPSTLGYGQLTKFLEPALLTRKIVHLYLDIALPAIPQK